MRLGILVSGRGSNLEAILRARPSGIEPVVVISNRPAVRALDVAAAHGIPTRVLRRAEFGGDAAARDAAIGRALADAGVELAILAGYDQLLSSSYFEAFGGRTINIHPSLLPAHGGAGMLGLAVHRAVLASGDRETGATVHEVGAGAGCGPGPVTGARPRASGRRRGDPRRAGPGGRARTAGGDARAPGDLSLREC